MRRLGSERRYTFYPALIGRLVTLRADDEKEDSVVKQPLATLLPAAEKAGNCRISALQHEKTHGLMPETI